jgi:hypothetical protein
MMLAIVLSLGNFNVADAGCRAMVVLVGFKEMVE